MMTQMKPSSQDSLEGFDVFALENKLAADYEKAQRPYIDPDHEIDADSDWCSILCCINQLF